MKRIILFLAIASLVSSCKDKEVFDAEAAEAAKPQVKANSFDFATIQSVNLSVDYSAFKTYGPVFFSVYSENPYEGTDESISLKEGITPIFEAYTDTKGKFSEKICLPSYAQDLYVVTGNFMITDNLLNAKVSNGEAKIVATNYDGSESRRAARLNRAAQTNQLDYLYQLSYEVDVTTGANTGNQVYKDWFTPLGSWDMESGRPNYLLDKATADDRLIFSDEEMEGLYETVANALVANQTCREEYRIQADLTVERESEISATFLGSMTCWNNTLGYYYYNDANKPSDLKDLNIIMLFPNTQDGKWRRDWCKNPNFYGNIALERGDVVKLMYYPNIANGDLSGATSKFPKGTKIGFIMKSNGWGMQATRDGKKFFNSYNGLDRYHEAALSRQYNVWAASTDGMSYCNTTGLKKDDCKIQNPNRESRTAKFAYKNEDGIEYAIVGFEDACNDLDYDDIVLALKPANAFSKLPLVEDKKTSSTGVYAFEDLWPSKGDYDMNDVMAEVTREKTYSVTVGKQDYKIRQEIYSLTTYQNIVNLKTGLAATIETKEPVSSIVMKKVNPATKDTTEVNFEVDGKTYLLTNDVKAEIGTTYIIEINYRNGFTKLNNVAVVKPFIFRTMSEGRWEVHLPYEAPTNRMITSFFGTEDDMSVPAEGKYFVRSGDYPFAFYLEGVSISSFKETLLERANEKRKISELYPDFLPWATSNGAAHADWYLHPFGK